MERLWGLGMNLAFVLLLPVLVPVLLIREGIYRRRLRTAARRFACGGCGSPLGDEAIRLADEECGRRIDPRAPRRRSFRFRTTPTLDAVCPSCGRRYRYVRETRTFVEESAADPLTPSPRKDAL